MLFLHSLFKKIFLVLPAVWLAISVVNAAELNNRETPIVKVVRNTAASVVNISTEKIVLLRQNPFWGSYGSDFDNLFDQFSMLHGMTTAMKLKSVGSGVIVDKSGLIVTNAHVVNMASSVYVILNDGAQAPGEVVYQNKNDDLAFIKIIPPKALSQAVLGQTKDIMPGESVVAIGNPLGLENTVTSGIVSGKNRKFYTGRGELIFDDILQIDAPINPGNSGGALFNLDGELIGINVAVVQSSQNIGFAVPVEKVKQVLEDYKYKQSLAPSKKPVAKQRVLFDGKDTFYEPDMNMEETAKEYIFKMNISGLNKNKVNAEINANSITVKGEYSSSSEEKAAGSVYNSQTYGSFIRTLPLPGNADPKNSKSEIKDDTFIIRISKKK